MSISTTSNRKSYNGNGSTLIFAYDFLITDETHLNVYKVTISTGAKTLLTIATDYTVSGVGDGSGGNVTLTGSGSGAAPTTLEQLLIVREVPLTQLVDYVANDKFPANTHEGALDKLTMALQQHDELIDRSVKLPITSSQTNVDFPEGTSASNRSQKHIRWDSAGTALELITVQDVQTAIQTKGDLVQGGDSGTAEKLAATALGAILYIASTVKAAWLSGNTTSTKKFLTQTGDGSASAAPAWNTLASSDIPDLGVTTAKIDASAVTTAKIADTNVTTAKLADSSVTTAKIADTNVTTAKLADSSVTTAKIADANVTTAKLADSSVTTAKGGTGQNLSSTAQGSTLYFSGTGTVAALAPGTSGQFLKTQGAGANPVWADGSVSTGSMILRTTSDAEATTTSSTQTTLKTLSSLSIPMTSSAVLIFSIRKAVGAAESMSGRLTINGSVVGTNRGWAAGNNATGVGQVVFIIGPRTASYLRGLTTIVASYDGSSTESVYSAGTDAADLPNATITSIGIQAANSGGTVTVGVANVKLYELLGV